jgi:hypothetical protein
MNGRLIVTDRSYGTLGLKPLRYSGLTLGWHFPPILNAQQKQEVSEEIVMLSRKFIYLKMIGQEVMKVMLY